jgi:ABC-type ATPase involved in cell division
MNLDEESADEILTLMKEINLLGMAVLLATRHFRPWSGIIPKTFRLEKGRSVGVGI